MSGGHWDYMQYRFTDVSEDIEKLIEKNGQPKTTEELKQGWHDDEWYKKYPEDKYHHKYPPEVIEEFKKGAEIIKLAQIYMNRIDWLLSGDDGEETFISRLKKDKEILPIPEKEILPELVNTIMMVSHNGKDWKKRNVIALSNGAYVTSSGIRTCLHTDEEFQSVTYWKFAKKI